MKIILCCCCDKTSGKFYKTMVLTSQNWSVSMTPNTSLCFPAFDIQSDQFKMASAEHEKDLVRSLTSLVTAARGVINATASPIPSQSVEERLKQLFPSTQGGGRNASSEPSKSRRNDDESGATISNSSCNDHSNSGGRNMAADVWGPQKKVNRKRQYPLLKQHKLKGKKYVEVLKDVFLVADPTVDKVPRKSDRQYYYRNDLVASAVKFHNSMTETDIRVEIQTHFPQYDLHSFTFLKAVDDSLIAPDIENWDYAVLKHVTGQGPIYIRSIRKIKVKDILCDGDLSEESADDEEFDTPPVKLFKSAVPVSLVAKQVAAIPERFAERTSSHSSPPLTSQTSDPSSSSSVPHNYNIESYFKKELSCHICYKMFSSKLIEEHASVCASKFDEVFAIVDSDEDVNDVTYPYGNNICCSLSPSLFIYIFIYCLTISRM